MRQRAGAQPASVLRGVAYAIVTSSLIATVLYTVGSIVHRPWDTVEGEVLFEAARIRRGLPLYVDAAVGAFDYGPIPARYYILYPPIASWVLSHVPAAAAATAARTFDSLAWFGLLGFIAGRAEPACRRAAVVAAGFTGAAYVLTLFATTARPDMLALLLATTALERSVQKGRVDVPAAILFALAPWVKPNVIGLATGAFLVHLKGRTPKRWAALAAALATSVVAFSVLQIASGGAGIAHLLRSTAQPLSLALWQQQLASRGPFFGLPLAFAAWCGWRARGSTQTPRGVQLAFGALGMSIAWATFSLGKIGSASNYFIEPALAAVVLLSRARIPPVGKRAELGLSAVGLAQALWSGVASVRSSYEDLVQHFPAETRALAHAREACGASLGDLILGDETGIELRLDGRIVATPFQLTHLVRRGLYPVGPWIEDVRRPEVVGVVMEDDLLERPLSQVSVEHDRFGPELRAVLRERFALAETNGAWRTYCAGTARPSTSRPMPAD